MSAESFKRKLTAVLSADVKGYSRLMDEDEEGTIRILNAYMGVYVPKPVNKKQMHDAIELALNKNNTIGNPHLNSTS